MCVCVRVCVCVELIQCHTKKKLNFSGGTKEGQEGELRGEEEGICQICHLSLFPSLFLLSLSLIMYIYIF